MLPNSGGKNGRSKPREAYALIPKFSTRIEERRNPNSNKYNAMRTHWSTDHTKINMDWSLHYSNKSNQILHSTRTEACNSGEQQQNTLSTCLRWMFDSIKRLTDTHTHTLSPRLNWVPRQSVAIALSLLLLSSASLHFSHLSFYVLHFLFLLKFKILVCCSERKRDKYRLADNFPILGAKDWISQISRQQPTRNIATHEMNGIHLD